MSVKYFMVAQPEDGRNYDIVRKCKNGQLVRDQAIGQELLTPKEHEKIKTCLPGIWITCKTTDTYICFGVRWLKTELYGKYCISYNPDER